MLLAAGVIQFIDDPFARLAAAPALPEHLILNKVPVYDMPSAVTLHNMGTAFSPYHLFNRRELLDAITRSATGWPTSGRRRTLRVRSRSSRAIPSVLTQGSTS